MTDPQPSAEPAAECADDDHDWEYISDWAGDPNVIGGTFSWRYKVCKTCGKDAEWDGQPDDQREYEHEDFLND